MKSAVGCALLLAGGKLCFPVSLRAFILHHWGNHSMVDAKGLCFPERAPPKTTLPPSKEELRLPESQASSELPPFKGLPQHQEEWKVQKYRLLAPLVQTPSYGGISTWWVCYRLLRCFICFTSFSEANASILIAKLKEQLRGEVQWLDPAFLGIAWSWRPRWVHSDRESAGWPC